jgi:hypothetical protein
MGNGRTGSEEQSGSGSGMAHKTMLQHTTCNMQHTTCSAWITLISRCSASCSCTNSRKRLQQSGISMWPRHVPVRAAGPLQHVVRHTVWFVARASAPGAVSDRK